MNLPERLASASDAQRRMSYGLWTAALVAGLTLAGCVAAAKAVQRPFWFDELFTLTIATLESPAAILQALRVPLDIMPPPYYLICRAALQLTPDEHLGLRLPSLIGYLVTIAGVYAFLASRVDRVSALTGAAFVTCTVLADYAYEARPYALMTGSLCVAACAWQRADRSWWWTVGLACSLGLAVSCHYYAVFAWPAFGLAELLVLVGERRFRPRVWLAFLVGLIPFIICWPLLANFREVAGKTWWSPPRLGQVVLAPRVLFKWTGGMWGPAIAAVLAALCGLWIVQPLVAMPPRLRTWLPPSPLRPSECGLAFGLIGIPVVAVVATSVARGGMTERYMMPAIIGAAVIIGAITGTARPAFRTLALAIVLLTFALAERPGLISYGRGPSPDPRGSIANSCETFISALRDDSSPIVVANGLQYLQLVHYCNPETRSRLTALADPRLAVSFNGIDVVDNSLLAIARHIPMNVSGYDDFISRNGSFLARMDDAAKEWLLAKLLVDGHTIEVIARQPWGMVYRVTVKKR